MKIKLPSNWRIVWASALFLAAGLNGAFGGQTRPELSLGRTPDYDYDPPAPGSYRLAHMNAAADGKVLGTDGKPIALHELFANKIVILSFIYTRCSDPRACMRATGVMSQLQRLTRQDPELARNVLLLTMSFDPSYDTPEVLARYGKVFGGEGADKDKTGSGAEWLFLTTRSQKELQPILEAYGQRVDRREKPNASGPYYHPVRVYLIDTKKQIRNIYSYGLLDPRLVVTDVRTLLMEDH